MIAIVLINILVVSLAVLIHTTSLWQLARLIKNISNPQLQMVTGVIGCLVAHAFEIWLFALTFFLLINHFPNHSFLGLDNPSLLDCVYFSFTTFSTLGYGDLTPLGHIRFVAGIESLTGLVLVAWTASFLFLEMKNSWDPKNPG